MGRIEALSQFIVPLIFLAIWALTSILNRDAQPLPQRPARPGTRPGPNALGPAARGQAATGALREREAAGAGSPPRRPVADRATNPASGRPSEWTAPSNAQRVGRRPAGDGMTEADVYIIDDELVFVDPVSRTPIGSARAPVAADPRTNPRSAVARKPSRGKKQDPSGGRSRDRDEATKRVLSDQVGQSMSLDRGRTLDLGPLSSKLTSLGDTSLRNATSTAATVASSTSPPALTAAQVRSLFTELPKLREVALLAELLQPPVSLRGRSRGR